MTISLNDLKRIIGAKDVVSGQDIVRLIDAIVSELIDKTQPVSTEEKKYE